jgi:hypothetical protein
MTAGEMCGNISAASLATIPVPTSLETGSFACNEGYTASNTMLDLIVGGCHATFLNIPAVNATQPDQVDPGAAAAGAGAPYQLTMANHSVTGCTDKTGASVDLGACLKSAAYSGAFKFTSDRVMVTGIQ